MKWCGAMGGGAEESLQMDPIKCVYRSGMLNVWALLWFKPDLTFSCTFLTWCGNGQKGKTLNWGRFVNEKQKIHSQVDCLNLTLSCRVIHAEGKSFRPVVFSHLCLCSEVWFLTPPGGFILCTKCNTLKYTCQLTQVINACFLSQRR